jgi:hypothetical protein
LVVVIFILEVVAGVLAFYYRTEIESVLSRELKEGIRTKYVPENQPDDTGLRNGWAVVQSTVSRVILLQFMVLYSGTISFNLHILHSLGKSFN